jgi:hypothetical protein
VFDDEVNETRARTMFRVKMHNELSPVFMRVPRDIKVRVYVRVCSCVHCVCGSVSNTLHCVCMCVCVCHACASMRAWSCAAATGRGARPDGHTTARACVCVCGCMCMCHPLNNELTIQVVFSTSETIAGVCALSQA